MLSLMTTASQQLRDEHAEILPHVEEIRALADSVITASPEELRDGIRQVEAFLTKQLLPHAAAEEKVLYAAISEIAGGPLAVALMSRDHAEMREFAEECSWILSQIGRGPVTPGLANAARRVLYGLYALLRLHLAKEDEICASLLDETMTAAEAGALFQKMGEATSSARTGKS